MAVLQEPIFIIGSPRSGTSILTWCLGQHPNILPLEESNWFAPLALALQSCYEIGTARNERSQLSAMRITREQLLNSIGMAINDLIRCQRNAYEQAFCELDVASPNSAANIFRPSRSSADPKQRWVDGTPEYAMDVFGLRLLFPQCKFIHILRDARSVVRSLLHFSKVAGFDLVKSEQEAYEYWKRTVLACVSAERAFGSDVVLRIKYDDLVAEPELTLRTCLTFVGEEFYADCLAPMGVQINSSTVPTDYDPADPRTDQQFKGETLELSRVLLEQKVPADVGSAKVVSELEVEFLKHARYLAWAGKELSRRLAAERECPTA